MRTDLPKRCGTRSPTSIQRHTVRGETSKNCAISGTVQNGLLFGFDLLAMATSYVALVVVSEDRKALRVGFTSAAGSCISISARN